LIEEELQMADHVDTTSEPRKEWAAPELKKIDVEEITASTSGGSGGDFFNFS
jgi:hypothetical protein